MAARILFCAFDLIPSPKGASTHITYFVRGLVAAGHQVTLITAGDPALPEQASYYGATLWRVPWQGEPHFLRRALAFGEYVLDHLATAPPYDVAHVRSIWSGFPLAQVKGQYGYQLLYEVNGLPSIETKYHYPAMRGARIIDKFKEQELATCHAATAIVCVSQVTAMYLHSLGVEAGKISVIPNGFDPQLFSQFPDGASLPTTLPAESEAWPTLLYIGTLADWQGLDTLVRAMPHIVAQRPARLRIVGRGRKRQLKMLRKLARKLEVEAYVSVEAAVKPRQVPALIAEADICLAPLGFNDRNVTQGCCPIKVLEYMAGGKPVVAANLPVIRELVNEGVEAVLFQPDDPVDLAQAILRLLADPDQAAGLGARARQRAYRDFTWQLAQERLRQVYQTRLHQPDSSAAAS